MQHSSDNPYLAPQAMETIPMKDEALTSSFSWVRWVAFGVPIQACFTALLIYLDSIQVVGDSGLWCCFVSAGTQALICMFIGLRYEQRAALQLSQLVNAIVWLTIIATAHIVVPRLLLMPIRRETDWIFLGIWTGGMLVSALIAWAFGRFR